MDIYFCNINNINEDVEDFVIAKNKIEKPLIENEQLDKKMTIKEFLEYVNLTNNILILNNDQNTGIPFNIYNTKKDEYVIIYSSVINDNDKLLKKHLEKINYDLNNLSEINVLDMIEGKLKIYEYYIINNKYYID